jgi:hypothetical protein
VGCGCLATALKIHFSWSFDRMASSAKGKVAKFFINHVNSWYSAFDFYGYFLRYKGR